MKTRKMMMVVMAVLALVVFASVALAASVTLQGMVISNENGQALDTGDQVYSLKGENLGEMEGKKVSVTGTVEDGDGGTKILVVESIEELSE